MGVVEHRTNLLLTQLRTTKNKANDHAAWHRSLLRSISVAEVIHTIDLAYRGAGIVSKKFSPRVGRKARCAWRLA